MKEITFMFNLVVNSSQKSGRSRASFKALKLAVAAVLCLPNAALSGSRLHFDPFYAHPRHRPPGRGSEDMKCPRVVSDDDRLIIDVEERRGDDFGVTRPGSDDVLWLGVSDSEFVNGSKITPTGTVLKALGLGRVRVRDMVAWTGDYPVNRVRVFTKPGTYLFEIAESFETEDPIVYHWCNIIYKPAPRLHTAPRR